MTPTETEPHLHAVPKETSDAGSEDSSAATPAETQERSTPLWAWVAVAALVFCAVGWYTAYQGGVELRGQLEQTQAALAQSEAAVAAHESHLKVVREQTAALVTSIGSLAADAEALAAKTAETPAP